MRSTRCEQQLQPLQRRQQGGQQDQPSAHAPRGCSPAAGRGASKRFCESTAAPRCRHRCTALAARGGGSGGADRPARQRQARRGTRCEAPLFCNPSTAGIVTAHAAVLGACGCMQPAAVQCVCTARSTYLGPCGFVRDEGCLQAEGAGSRACIIASSCAPPPPACGARHARSGGGGGAPRLTFV